MDMTTGQMVVAKHLRERSKSVRELQELTGRGPGIRSILTALEKKGVVARMPNPGGTGSVYSLTEDGFSSYVEGLDARVDSLFPWMAGEG